MRCCAGSTASVPAVDARLASPNRPAAALLQLTCRGAVAAGRPLRVDVEANMQRLVQFNFCSAGTLCLGHRILGRPAPDDAHRPAHRRTRPHRQPVVQHWPRPHGLDHVERLRPDARRPCRPEAARPSNRRNARMKDDMPTKMIEHLPFTTEKAIGARADGHGGAGHRLHARTRAEKR